MRYLAFASALALLAACGQTPATSTTTTSTAEQTAPAALPPAPMTQVSLADFVEKAAITDMFEVEAGRLAAQRTRVAAIRHFAQQMVREHTATTNELKRTLASVQSAPTPPTALDQEHQQKLTDLRNAAADRFDEIYLDQQTQAHEQGLQLLRDYAERGDNAAVQQFASQTAPKVEQHLTMVRELDRGGADEQAQAMEKEKKT